MNKYVVGYFSDHVGELFLEEVEADDKHAALIKYLDLDVDEFDTEEKIYVMLANNDATANVLQINKSRSGRSGRSGGEDNSRKSNKYEIQSVGRVF